MALVQQGTAALTNGGPSLTVTSASATAGNLLVLPFWWTTSSGTSPPVAPAGWSTALVTPTAFACNGIVGGFFTGAGVYYIQNCAAGVTTAVINSGGTGTWAVRGRISEWSGQALSSVINASAIAGSAGPVTTGSVSATSTVANTLVFATVAGPQLTNTTNVGITNPPTGATSLDVNQDATTAVVGETAYALNVAAGTQSPSWSWTPSGEWAAIVVAFAPAPLGVTGVQGTGGVGSVGVINTTPPTPTYNPLGQIFPPVLGRSGKPGAFAPGVFQQMRPGILLVNAALNALTGVSGTGGVGSVTPNLALPLTGVSGTGSVGSVAVGQSLGLTGVSGTGSVGSVGVSTSSALTGVTGTGSVGSVSVSQAGALTGVSGTGGVGTVTPSVSGIGLAGVIGTGSVGQVGTAVSYGLSGVSGTGGVGVVLPFSGTLLALTGVSATGSVGTVSLTKGLVPNVVGAPLGVASVIINNATFQVGSLSYENSAIIPLGSVINQTPAAGTPEFEDSNVNLVISSGFPVPTNNPTGGIKLPNLPNKILPPDTPLVDNNGVIATNWWRFLLNTSNQAMGTNQTQPATVTVGSSPYVFTTPAQGTLLVSGGPVTLIEYSKDGKTWYPTGVTQGQIQMVPNDQVRITYMNKPTLTFFPR